MDEELIYFDEKLIIFFSNWPFKYEILNRLGFYD